MPVKSDLLVRIDATLAPLNKSLDRASKRLKRFAFRAERTGGTLTRSLSVPILAIGGAAVRTFSQLDRYEKGLAAINGSAEAGKQQLGALLELVKDTRTTLDLSTAANASVQLQSVGFSAQESSDLLQQLGLSATVSASSVQDVSGVVRQFTQIVGKGKIEQEDFNTILERVPVLGNLIRNELGFQTAEQIRESGISMTDFILRLTKAAEKSEILQNANGGLQGAFTSLRISLQQTGFTFGQAIVNALDLENRLNSLASFLGRVADAFAALNPSVQKFIVLTTLGAASAGPLIFGLGAAARLLPTLVSGFNILTGPLSKALRAIIQFGAATRFSFSLFLSGGLVSKAVKIGGLLQAPFVALRVAAAALISPVGLIAIGIAALVTGFIAAYRNSEFFRRQIDRLVATVQGLFSVLGELIGDALTPLKGIIGGVANAFKSILPVLAGITSAIIEFITLIVEDFTLAFATFGDVINRRISIKQALANLTRLNISNVKLAGARLGTAFVTTFNETVESLNNTNEIVSDPNAAAPSGGRRRRRSSGSGGPGAFTGASQLLPTAFDRESVDNAQITLRLLERASEAATEINFAFGQITGTGSFLNFAERDAQVMRELAETANNELAVAFQNIDQQSKVFGETQQTFNDKLQGTKDAILFLLSEGFEPTSAEITALTEKYALLGEQQQAFNDRTEMATLLQQQFSQASGKAFDSVARAINDGENAMKAFGKAVVGALRDAIAAVIKLGVAQQIEKALVSVPFPFNVGIAAAAGAAASALFTSAINAIGIPALATGGVVGRPTLALIGEAGPEAVVPLNRYNQMLNNGSPGGVQVFGEFRLQGDDLIVAVDRARQSQNRGG